MVNKGSLDKCEHTGDPCDDGVWCNGDETCVEKTGECIDDIEEPCESYETCNEDKNVCEPGSGGDPNRSDDSGSCGCG